jgi:hypothetical protein
MNFVRPLRRAFGAPQGEGELRMAITLFLILRSPPGGSLEGRTGLIPTGDGP